MLKPPAENQGFDCEEKVAYQGVCPAGNNRLKILRCLVYKKAPVSRGFCHASLNIYFQQLCLLCR